MGYANRPSHLARHRMTHRVPCGPLYLQPVHVPVSHEMHACIVIYTSLGSQRVYTMLALHRIAVSGACVLRIGITY